MAGLVLLVPLAIWAATGRAKAGWRALKAYGGIMSALGLLIGAGALVGLIAAALSS